MPRRLRLASQHSRTYCGFPRTPRNSPCGPRTLANFVARTTWPRRSQIDIPVGQLPAEFGPAGEVPRQFFQEGQGLVIGFLRLPGPAGVAQQIGQAVVAGGPMAPKVGPCGEVSLQALAKGQEVVVRCLGVLEFTESVEDLGDTHVAF